MSWFTSQNVRWLMTELESFVFLRAVFYLSRIRKNTPKCFLSVPHEFFVTVVATVVIVVFTPDPGEAQHPIYYLALEVMVTLRLLVLTQI
jgi:hypothetical protein